MRLKNNLLLTYGLGGILLISIITTLIFIYTQKAMSDQLRIQFLTDSESHTLNFTQHIKLFSNDLTQITKLPIFKSLRYHELTLNEPAKRDDIRQIELYFIEQQIHNPYIQEIQLIDTSGMEIINVYNKSISTSHKDYSINNNILTALNLKSGQTEIVLQQKDGSPNTLTWRIPLYISNNVHLGILIIHVDFKYIQNTINNISKDNTKWICLYDHKRTLIETNNSQCNYSDNDIWTYNGAINLHNISWQLDIQTNQNSYLTDVVNFRRVFYGLILPLVVIIVFITTALLSKRLTSSIHAIVQSAHLLGTDKPYKPVTITYTNELSELSNELNRTADLILSRHNELIQTNNELETYSYTIAHDLRTPLRSISGFSSLLLSNSAEKLDADELSHLQRIVSATDKMNHLIDDILELSKITRHEETIETVNISTLSKNILNELYESEPERTINWEIEDDLITRGDPKLLQIMLTNIINNAWKYTKNTDQANIHIYSTITNNEKYFCVKDNGVGFDMKYANKLFTPFERLHNHNEFEGTGIGLATVHRIIAKHHGQIWADSKPGKGTVICFSLDKPSHHS
ncbi:MAG: ATP-binding protein [Gammaproteobacteria bacterium]|nr:ATP-binding protein [Gammaproteobacteria bacterium]